MLTVRRMTQADCVKAAQLEKEIFSQPWSEQGFLDAISMEQNIFLVAEDVGEICGYIGMYQALDEGEITNVAVSPEKRNAGIGWKLMQAALETAKEQGISRVVLEVRVSNASAIHLYENVDLQIAVLEKDFMISQRKMHTSCYMTGNINCFD